MAAHHLARITRASIDGPSIDWARIDGASSIELPRGVDRSAGLRVCQPWIFDA
jgi:hypothetical protein